MTIGVGYRAMDALMHISPFLDSSYRLYSDLPGFEAPHGGTIPPDILVTNLKPDLFLVSETKRKAIVFELTCPWDGNVERSHAYKEGKYAPLVADLSRNFSVLHYSVEVTVRGQVTKENKNRIKSFVFSCCLNPGKLAKKIGLSMSKASLLSSYSIFSARKEPAWMGPLPLTVN